jgi:DNA-nicking Smr family endonuclease
VIRTAKRKGIQLEANFLEAVIETFARGNQWEWCEMIYEEWLAHGHSLSSSNCVSMVRLLAINGQASSATRVVSSSLSYHSLTVKTSGTEGYLNFARSTYFGTITAAHRAGLTALADLLYTQAVEEGTMEWAVKENTDSQVTLDLHGTNVAVAVAGVRVGLRESFRALPESGMPNIIIVTGRGLNSKTRFKPVLRGEVQDLLINEFYPPITSSTARNNLGALELDGGDVKEWVQWERKVKGR